MMVWTFDDRTLVGRGKAKALKDDREHGFKSSKRSLSSDDENRRKVIKDEFKVILKFRKEDENMNQSLITACRELKKETRWREICDRI